MFDTLNIRDFVGDVSETKQFERQQKVDVKQGYLRQNNRSEMSETIKRITILPMLLVFDYWHYPPLKYQA